MSTYRGSGDTAGVEAAISREAQYVDEEIRLTWVFGSGWIDIGINKSREPDKTEWIRINTERAHRLLEVMQLAVREAARSSGKEGS